jgi:hypothetical protein
MGLGVHACFQDQECDDEDWNLILVCSLGVSFPLASFFVNHDCHRIICGSFGRCAQPGHVMLAA